MSSTWLAFQTKLMAQAKPKQPERLSLFRLPVFRRPVDPRPNLLEEDSTDFRDSFLKRGASFKAESEKAITALDAARTWLRECRENHECSKHKQEEQWLPTRLIDLCSGHVDEVQVRKSSEIIKEAPYATLSHCWGHHVPDCLKLSTETELREGRKANLFCPLFQQAFAFTKAMGIQYLWIDSLCICQGDGGDWDVEAGNMSKVYSNSTLNLAASGALDGNHHLLPLRKRDPPLDLVTKSGGTKYAFRYAYWARQSKTFESLPLHSRAWVVQELYLSRRIIYFTPNQLFWRCLRTRASEYDPTGAYEAALPNIKYHTMFHRHESNLCQEWRVLVEQYMSTELTYPTDRLIAFSGIARDFLTRFHADGERTNYIAGLWQHNFVSDLLWIKYEPCPKTSQYVVPSWSWASSGHSTRVTFAPVSLPDHDTSLDMRILFTDVKPIVPGDQFGQLSAAYITVSCASWQLHTPLSSLYGSMQVAVETANGPDNIYFQCYPDTPLPAGQEAQVTVFFVICRSSKKHGVEGLVLLNSEQGRVIETPEHTSTLEVFERWGYWHSHPWGEAGDALFHYHSEDLHQAEWKSYTIV